MARVHLAPHLDDIRGEARAVTRQTQNSDALRFERRADCGIAADEACAGQRLVLPRPRGFALVFAEGRKTRHQQAGSAVGTQAKIGVVEPTRCSRAREPGVQTLREPRIPLDCAIGIRRVRFDVVQEHEIEVGRVAQLFSAELAVADDGKARTGLAAAQMGPASCERRVEDGVGERGEMVRETLDSQRAAQILCQQAKCLCLLKMAERIHFAFGVLIVRRKEARQFVAPRLPIGLGEERACIEKLVQQNRMPRQIIGGPRRRPQQMRETRQQGRMFDEQREIGAAAADRLEQ